MSLLVRRLGADPDFPAINARVSSAADFIVKTVCEYSAYPPPDFHCEGPTDAPSNMPSAAPTIAPTTETHASHSNNTFGLALEVFLGLSLLGLALYWLMKKGSNCRRYEDWSLSESWVPLKKHHTMETEYLSSPDVSPRSLGSPKGTYKYDAL